MPIFMHTAKLERFELEDISVEDIHITDIANALSKICRYAGHCSYFYSVAEHCCHLVDLVDDEYKKWALLHDAVEVYTGDIIRPVRAYLQKYTDALQDLEFVVLNAIAHRFDLSWPVPTIVLEKDTAIIPCEISQLFSHPANKTETTPNVQLQYWSPLEAQTRFLYHFNLLFG